MDTTSTDTPSNDTPSNDTLRYRFPLPQHDHPIAHLNELHSLIAANPELLTCSSVEHQGGEILGIGTTDKKCYLIKPEAGMAFWFGQYLMANGVDRSDAMELFYIYMSNDERIPEGPMSYQNLIVRVKDE